MIYIHQVKTQKIDSIVLLTFGIGNGPDGNKSFQTYLRACKERNIPVYNVSQCCQGRVEQGDYATGSFLNTMSVVGGLDLTLEAAFTKACWAATQYPDDAASQKTCIRTRFSRRIKSSRNRKDLKYL